MQRLRDVGVVLRRRPCDDRRQADDDRREDKEDCVDRASVSAAGLGRRQQGELPEAALRQVVTGARVAARKSFRVGCVPGREKQIVPVAQRHLELLGEVEHHLGTRT